MPSPSFAGNSDVKLSHGEFVRLRQVIHSLCGLHLSDEKEYLVRHRLEPVAQAHGCADFEGLLSLLRHPSAELRDEVIEAITTSETSFFRDGHPYEALRGRLLPELARQLRERRDKSLPGANRIRFWSAGTATGEEAHSLGMIVLEFLASPAGQGLEPPDFSVLGSDISAKAVARAAAGRFQKAQLLRGLSGEQIRRFFEPDGADFVARAELRQLLEFRRVNLVEPLPLLGPFDVILCRNVLIYFDDATKRRICEQFYSLLNPHGTVLLGSMESMLGLSSRFASERVGATILYRRGS